MIAALDPIGFSPVVMQSNNDFGVAATYSVNAHGWPAPFGPFGSTVRSLRLMLADGTILACSRSENADLFALAMGGYGLFGIILDLEVEMTPNLLLEPTFEVMASADFATRFMEVIETDRSLRMTYGRLSLSRDDFFEEALLVIYRPAPASRNVLPPAEASSLLTAPTRWIYRSQIGRDAAKQARWFAEKTFGPIVSGTATRNTLLNESLTTLAGASRDRTDILHEYFVPPERFDEFVAACREVIPRFGQDILNVTMRYVASDEMSVLAFAPTRRIAAVMSFSQAITPEAEADMAAMTEGLIDRVVAIGGSFYLPYRLHARPDQIEKAYPRVEYFQDRKRHYDPRLLFRNFMWDAYFAA